MIFCSAPALAEDPAEGAEPEEAEAIEEAMASCDAAVLLKIEEALVGALVEVVSSNVALP